MKRPVPGDRIVVVAVVGAVLAPVGAAAQIDGPEESLHASYQTAGREYGFLDELAETPAEAGCCTKQQDHIAARSEERMETHAARIPETGHVGGAEPVPYGQFHLRPG